MSKPVIVTQLTVPGCPALSLSPNILHPLEKSFIVKPATTDDEFLRLLPEADYVLCWSFKKEWFSIAPKLKELFTPAAGRDWIESPESDSEIKIHHGTFHGQLIAESLLGMITYFNNNYDQAVEDQKKHNWARDRKQLRRRLTGQTIMIIGYGSIGKTCADYLTRFNCKIYGVQRRFNAGNDKNNDTTYLLFDQLSEYLPKADHVVSILPGHPSTDKIITDEHFTAMKSDAVFYNFGRGNCVKEETLVKALQNREIRGAGLDVFEEEPLPEDSKLWNFPNALLTPHSSCFYQEYGPLFIQEVMFRLLSENL